MTSDGKVPVPGTIDPGAEVAKTPEAVGGNEINLGDQIASQRDTLTSEVNSLAATNAGLSEKINDDATIDDSDKQALVAGLSESDQEAAQVIQAGQQQLDGLLVSEATPDGNEGEDPLSIDNLAEGDSQSPESNAMRNPPKIDNDPEFTKWVRYLSKADFSYSPDEVNENAHSLFAQEHPEEAGKYKQAEEKGIWDDPSQDPKVMETERDIIRAVARTVDDAQKGRSGATAREDSRGNSLDFSTRMRAAESDHQWTSFAQRYPQKAEAYAGKDPDIAKALNFIRRKKSEVGDQNRASKIPQNGVIENIESGNLAVDQLEPAPVSDEQNEIVPEQEDSPIDDAEATGGAEDEGGEEEGVVEPENMAGDKAQEGEPSTRDLASEPLPDGTVSSPSAVSEEGPTPLKEMTRNITSTEISRRVGLIKSRMSEGGDVSATMLGQADEALNSIISDKKDLVKAENFLHETTTKKDLGKAENFLQETTTVILNRPELYSQLEKDARSFSIVMKGYFKGSENEQVAQELFGDEKKERQAWQLFRLLDPNRQLNVNAENQSGSNQS